MPYDVHIEEAARRWIERRSGGQFLRLGLKSSGCNGYSYVVEFAGEAAEGEQASEANGVKLLLRAEDARLMSGMKLELKESQLDSRIVFNNPNTKSACGCGSSVGF